MPGSEPAIGGNWKQWTVDSADDNAAEETASWWRAASFPRKPLATSKIFNFMRTTFLNKNAFQSKAGNHNTQTRFCCSYDIDLDTMTLTHKLDLYILILMTYRHTRNGLSRSRLSKVRTSTDRETDRQTQRQT